MKKNIRNSSGAVGKNPIEAKKFQIFGLNRKFSTYGKESILNE